MENKNKLVVKDWLAIERTKLANERTFLAYFRTSFVLFGTGIGIFKIELFSDIQYIGIVLMLLSPITLVIGIFRFFSVNQGISKRYQ